MMQEKTFRVIVDGILRHLHNAPTLAEAEVWARALYHDSPKTVTVEDTLYHLESRDASTLIFWPTQTCLLCNGLGLMPKPETLDDWVDCECVVEGMAEIEETLDLEDVKEIVIEDNRG